MIYKAASQCSFTWMYEKIRCLSPVQEGQDASAEVAEAQAALREAQTAYDAELKRAYRPSKDAQVRHAHPVPIQILHSVRLLLRCMHCMRAPLLQALDQI